MLKRAIELARTKAVHHRAFHGALVVNRDGGIVAPGWNMPGMHAEAMALKWIRVDPDYILISIRIRKDGRMAMARPCKVCMKLIKERGIKTIRYSDIHGNFVTEIL